MKSIEVSVVSIMKTHRMLVSFDVIECYIVGEVATRRGVVSIVTTHQGGRRRVEVVSVRSQTKNENEYIKNNT